jgi:nicotinate-nucleotide pyrophosphorylase (carboxylating)
MKIMGNDLSAKPVSPEMETVIRRALAEDRADRDITSLATIPVNQLGHARISAKAEGVLSGTVIARDVFAAIDGNLHQEWLKTNGSEIRSGEVICSLRGRLRSILTAERTALNFLQHLSGIATSTRRYVKAIQDTGCQIADTRKTTPGLRVWEKQAVLHGGGVNHRMDLASGMLVKENHIRAAGSLSKAIIACRRNSDVWLEVECETLDEVEEAVACKPDMILLDNMSVEQVAKARQLVPRTIILEASGGITLENVRQYAETGVNRLAIGAITHSAPALDLSMQVVNVE